MSKDCDHDWKVINTHLFDVLLPDEDTYKMFSLKWLSSAQLYKSQQFLKKNTTRIPYQVIAFATI